MIDTTVKTLLNPHRLIKRDITLVYEFSVEIIVGLKARGLAKGPGSEPVGALGSKTQFVH